MASGGTTANGDTTFTWPAPKTVLSVLLGLAAFLGVMHLLARLSGLDVLEAHWFMADEATVPTWWSGVQLLVLAAFLFILAKSHRFGPSSSRLMRLLAAVFVFFSVDEVAGIHESITGVFARFDGVPRFAGNHGVWIFAYAILAVVLLVVTLPGVTSMLREHRNLSLWFLLGIGIFIFGGVGVEIVGFYGGDTREFRTIQTLIEELLEITGVSVMVWAVYREVIQVRLRLGPNS